MTEPDFINNITARGASFWPPAPQRDIIMANTVLQNRRFAMLPKFLTDIYKIASGINMGNGYIFGPTELARNAMLPVPSIIQINDEVKNAPNIRGKTVFGRNDLFWFAFDAFGTCYMLDNTSFRVLRKYDDPYRAMIDCLVAGKY